MLDPIQRKGFIHDTCHTVQFLSNYLSICFSVYLSIHLYIYLSIYLSIKDEMTEDQIISMLEETIKKKSGGNLYF